MKITFLGSSHGVPAPDRYCTSLMVEVGEAVYIVDAGRPIIDAILRKGKAPQDIKAVFTTHAHGDHTNGLLPYIDLIHWYYKSCDANIYMTEQGLADALVNVVSTIHKEQVDTDRIKISIVEAGVVYDDGVLKATYIPTKHMEPRPSYSVLLEAEGKRVLITGDMSLWLAKEDFPIEPAEAGVDALISEMAHFGLDALTPYLERTRTKQAWITHVFPIAKLDEIAAIKDKYEYPIYIAHDDDAIEV